MSKLLLSRFTSLKYALDPSFTAKATLLLEIFISFIATTDPSPTLIPLSKTLSENNRCPVTFAPEISKQSLFTLAQFMFKKFKSPKSTSNASALILSK